MTKKTENFKTIYISQRILKKLSQIKTSSLTTIIAPMGYGKTTAINWFLEQEKNGYCYSESQYLLQSFGRFLA